MDFWTIVGVKLLITLLISILITKLLVTLLKRHPYFKEKTPPFGGVSVYVSFWIGVWLMFPTIRPDRSLLMIFLASTCVLITGIIDDWYELRPFQKSIGLLLASHIVYFGGQVQFSSVLLPNLSDKALSILIYVLTIAWLYIVTNAFNLLDGIDGLASSVAVTSLLTLAVSLLVFSVSIRLNFFMMLLFLAAAILGFIPFNWTPAKIYLGDTGALFIGFMYASLTVTSLKNVGLFSMVMPIVLFVVPLLDTSLAIVRRLLSGRSPLKGDKDHIHHRLLRYGLTTQQTVYLMVVTTLICSLFAIASYIYPSYRPLIMGAGLCMMIVIAMYLNKRQSK